MATRRASLHLGRFAALALLLGLGARQLIAPTPIHAQADSSRPLQRSVPRQAALAASGTPAVRDLFQQNCVECHGADGTGKKARRRLPEIPDFTYASWQARRDDAQLMSSILDGKGENMPPFGGEIDEGQVRSLMAYVRAFAPTAGTSGRADQNGPAQDEQAKDVPTGRFFDKLIRWLGRFHPPAVHFPIALLAAAAVAELLRLTTGKHAFEAVSRYCVWFGTLTALAAGILGWFRAPFRLVDASWVMMMHRWLGTSTVVSSGLVLILCELSRRPDRLRTRICFRVALLAVAVLVSVTGFFGGAVVFGLDHYRWPR
jgi:uncharacterized membrane protein/mono/diheme cytochrome c family protein